MSFVRKNNELERLVMQNAQGGPGEVNHVKIANSIDELYGKGRLFNDITLNPGCGVGYHMHKGDGEFYYIISGTAEYNDNGNVVTLNAGDVTFTGDGESHGITNNSNEPLRMIALVIYS